MSLVLAIMMFFAMDTIAFAAQTTDTDPSGIPSINYNNDFNGYEEFIFNTITRGTSEPSSKWNWNNGAYTVNGTSNSGTTLYSNYYFTDIVGRSFSFKAGSSNRISVDLVYKGALVQTVVSTWTIDAGSSKTVKIKESDLDGKSSSGKYYFRFNSNPLGRSYSVSGTFN